MFTRESCWRNMFPKLKGRAAEVKHFGPALMKAFAAMMDRGNVDHQSIHLALQMSVEIDRIRDDYPDQRGSNTRHYQELRFGRGVVDKTLERRGGGFGGRFERLREVEEAGVLAQHCHFCCCLFFLRWPAIPVFRECLHSTVPPV